MDAPLVGQADESGPWGVARHTPQPARGSGRRALAPSRLLTPAAAGGCPQNFLYETGLQNLPVYTLGISAGAAFATKVIKNFWDPNFGGIIKPAGIISGARRPGGTAAGHHGDCIQCQAGCSGRDPSGPLVTGQERFYWCEAPGAR